MEENRRQWMEEIAISDTLRSARCLLGTYLILQGWTFLVEDKTVFQAFPFAIDWKETGVMLGPASNLSIAWYLVVEICSLLKTVAELCYSFISLYHFSVAVIKHLQTALNSHSMQLSVGSVIKKDMFVFTSSSCSLSHNILTLQNILFSSAINIKTQFQLSRSCLKYLGCLLPVFSYSSVCSSN